ncbi:TIGR01906 family membrane protein [Arthrobacter sp. zg-Y411]|uniref:TIGR01906 family membrane protein n=1 Tax=Arthrobacter zhangbolii TaxID=2886936 RepID=UPI001D14FE46|nr:TIGR01906 family membrane protein [Arthrobacter zhangbolii]
MKEEAVASQDETPTHRPTAGGEPPSDGPVTPETETGAVSANGSSAREALHGTNEHDAWDAEFNGLSGGDSPDAANTEATGGRRDTADEPAAPKPAAAETASSEPAASHTDVAEPAEAVSADGNNAGTRESNGAGAAETPITGAAAPDMTVPGGHPAVAQRSHLPMRRASTLPDLSRYASRSDDSRTDTGEPNAGTAATASGSDAESGERSLRTPGERSAGHGAAAAGATAGATAVPGASASAASVPSTSVPSTSAGSAADVSAADAADAAVTDVHGSNVSGSNVPGPNTPGSDLPGSEIPATGADTRTAAFKTVDVSATGSGAAGASAAGARSAGAQAEQTQAAQAQAAQTQSADKDSAEDGADSADSRANEDSLSPAEAERRAREREKAAAGKPVLARVLQVMIAVFFPVMLLAAAIRAVATPLFLWAEYHRPGFPADSYGFTTDDRMTYGSYAVDYLLNWTGPRYLGDLVGDGGEPLYLESEVSHMADVKTVLTAAFVAAAVMAVLSICAAFYLARRSPGGIRRALFSGAAVTLVLVLVLLTLAILGWEQFFTQLHTVFFANGNWTFRLDDTLIRLFPAQFWMDAGIVIAALVLVTCAVVLACCWPTKARRNRARAAREAARRRYTDSLDAL